MSAVFRAEQSVLGGVLLDPGALSRIRPLLISADAFAHAHHRQIFAAMIGLQASAQPVDVVTLAEHMGDRLDDAGGVSYLGSLMADTPTAANVEAHAAIVAKDAYRRRCRSELERALDRLDHDDPGIVAGELQAELGRTQATTGALTMDELVDLGFAALSTTGRDLLSTGLSQLDVMLGGLEAGRLYVIAARTGGSKSALGLAVSHAIARAGHAVGVCSLEMPAREIAMRLFAHRYGVNLSALTRRHAFVGQELEERYARDPMNTLPMYIDDTSTELPQLIARALEWHYRYAIRALFVDYIGLITVRGSAPRHEKIGECSRTFKQLAKKLEIPVLIACQFNRESDRDERKPRLSDLRDSGSIEQDADAVIALHPAAEQDMQGRKLIEIGVLKNRSGTCGWLGKPITFDGRMQRFMCDASADQCRRRASGD